MPIQKAKFSIGDIVKHKHFEFRGVIYDVDFEFNNSENGISLSQKMLGQEKINLFIISC
jgi:hemimethylated DNA binding protein